MTTLPASGSVSAPAIPLRTGHPPLVFLFPGQSSVDPEMLARARQFGEPALRLLERAAHVLGPDDVARYTSPNGVRLDNNRDIQISGFLVTQMHLAALEAAGLRASHSLGLSLGEYSHLVHIGALSFEDALNLVSRRGAAYDDSPDGVMVAVLGATQDEVESAVARASQLGTVVVSNFNSPSQHVIAGERTAVEVVATWLEDECGASCVETERRVPMHSPLLHEVARSFRDALDSVTWKSPRLPYVPNVTGVAEPHPTREQFVERLTAHVTQPVRWRTSVEYIAEHVPDAWFIEVGPGTVIHNMLSRSWMPVKRARTDSLTADEIPSAFLSLLRALTRDD